MKSEVYSQSTWLAMQAAALYYMHGLSGKETADRLNISTATISRLLTRARESGMITFQIPSPFVECLEASRLLLERYNLKEAIIIPSHEESSSKEMRQAVALEGARYLQRTISDKDVIGVAWGRTMNHLIQVLNPCQKKDNTFVSMHGSIPHCQYNDVGSLVSRISMALGGQRFCFDTDALMRSKEELTRFLNMEENQKIAFLLKRISVSVSGVGSLYPELDSPLLNNNYLQQADIKALQAKGVYGDILLRFFDENGEECETDLKDRTQSIDFDTYRNIQTKIVVASGKQKAYTIRAVLRGELADVIILDYELAKQVIKISD